MWKKRKVWIVKVFFADGTGLPVSEEYTANSYEEIESVKKQIREEYAPKEIDEISVADEPEIREFWE